MKNSINQSGLLKVIVQVKDTGHGNATPADFFITIRNIKDATPNPNPQSFPGSKEGTTVSLQRGSYIMDASASTLGAWYDTTFSGDCTPIGKYEARVDIESNETKTCVITKTYSRS